MYETRRNKVYIGINREKQWICLVLRTKPKVQNKAVKASCWLNTDKTGRVLTSCHGI